jgi:predicted TIM-barrel fold metal-dependent hydrolase
VHWKVIVDAFGPSRINFAGNWFVLDQFGEWPAMVEAVDQALTTLQLNETAKSAIYAGNALRLYKLQ